MNNDVATYHARREREGASKEDEIATLAAHWAPHHFASDGKTGEPNAYARHFARAVLALGQE